ncbi:hypothetical protein [Aliiglaciecola litoralis]|uniref:DUF2383 domain-containing protein n=1 Tax=Aliiglaciecola litoralis TaxID=582857 RepID=A0ABP3WPF8_9ALTE
MSLPEMKPTLETPSNKGIVKSIISLCHQGDLFYQKIAMIVKSYSLKKVCFEMAKHYQYLADRMNRTATYNNHKKQQDKVSQFHIEKVYDADIEQIATQTGEETIVALSKMEYQNLSALKDSIQQIQDRNIKNHLSDIAAHIQTTLDKLNTLAESALKNEYSKQ